MAYTTADIRNVCLVGPGHAGKTQLAEALLAAGGAISHAGSVEKGDTVSDFSPKEKELGHSIYPSVCHLDHAGIHVNLIIDRAIEAAAFFHRTRSHARCLAKAAKGLDAHVMRTDVLFQHAVIVELKRRDTCRVIQQPVFRIENDVGRQRTGSQSGKNSR